MIAEPARVLPIGSLAVTLSSSDRASRHGRDRDRRRAEMARWNWPPHMRRTQPISARSCDSSKPEHSTRRPRRLFAWTHWSETSSPSAFTMRWYRAVDALDALAQPIRSLELQNVDAPRLEGGPNSGIHTRRWTGIDLPKRSPGRRPSRGAPNADQCLGRVALYESAGKPTWRCYKRCFLTPLPQNPHYYPTTTPFVARCRGRAIAHKWPISSVCGAIQGAGLCDPTARFRFQTAASPRPSRV